MIIVTIYNFNSKSDKVKIYDTYRYIGNKVVDLSIENIFNKIQSVNISY